MPKSLKLEVLLALLQKTLVHTSLYQKSYVGVGLCMICGIIFDSFAEETTYFPNVHMVHP